MFPGARTADQVDVQVMDFLPAVLAGVDNDAVAAFWIGLAAVFKSQLGGECHDFTHERGIVCSDLGHG